MISGLYSLKCSLGVGWWYWQGTCYWIEKNKKVTWNEAFLSCMHFKNTSLVQLDSRREKVGIFILNTSQKIYFIEYVNLWKLLLILVFRNIK